MFVPNIMAEPKGKQSKQVSAFYAFCQPYSVKYFSKPASLIIPATRSLSSSLTVSEREMAGEKTDMFSLLKKYGIFSA